MLILGVAGVDFAGRFHTGMRISFDTILMGKTI